MAQSEYRGPEHGVLQGAAPPPPKEHTETGFQVEKAGGYGKKTTQYESWYYPPPMQQRENSRSIQRDHRRRHQWSKAGPGGPGMQAIFLGSNQKSTGTGVFLPRKNDIDRKFSKKPGLSPVLLPSRVVHALNLNVHELGQKIKPQPGDQPKNTSVENTHGKSKNNNDQNDEDVYLSPEIYLPEEWTY